MAAEAPAMTAQNSEEKLPAPAKAEPVQQSPRMDLPGLKPLDKPAAVEQVAPLPAPKPQTPPAAESAPPAEATTARVRLDEAKPADATPPAPAADAAAPDKKTEPTPVPPPAKIALAGAEPKEQGPAPTGAEGKADGKPASSAKPAEPQNKLPSDKHGVDAPPKAAPKIAPVEPPDSPAAPAKSATGKAGKGTFAVQLGASKDEAKAKAEQQRLSKEKGIAAEVLRLPGDDFFHILVTGFGDRAAADAAKSALSEKMGAPCIVKKLS
jgi:hypothetical protein